MTCPPCANDQHEDCQVSHMGSMQAFCQCWCREVARQEDEEATSGEDDTVTLTRPLCVDGEFYPTETETLTVRRDQVVGL